MRGVEDLDATIIPTDNARSKVEPTRRIPPLAEPAADSRAFQALEFGRNALASEVAIHDEVINPRAGGDRRVAESGLEINRRVSRGRVAERGRRHEGHLDCALGGCGNAFNALTAAHFMSFCDFEQEGKGHPLDCCSQAAKSK